MSVVAVVDDNADSRLLVRAIVGQVHEVREYASGAEALVGFAASPPDLALLDISLPGITGVELLGRLRADPRFARLPAIALTAHATEGHRASYLAAGFDGFVSKPILDEAVLLRAIEDGLRRAQGARG
jgi:CheY-like chemotaxis protein